MIVHLTLFYGRAKINPSAYLGSEHFGRYHAACDQAGAIYDRDVKANVIELEAVPRLLLALQAAQFKPRLDPALTEALKARAEAARASLGAAQDRLEALRQVLKAQGLALYPFQEVGVAWLATRRAALLCDEMGCVDGEAIIQVNRAGKGFKIRLADLHANLSGELPLTWKARDGSRVYRGGRRWDPSIPTYCKALCDGILLQHRIVKSIDRGRRRVLCLTLESGKRLLLTPDHEVMTPEGLVACELLAPGDVVLTNGRIYAKGSEHPSWRGGRFIDSDGYVRVKLDDHPRANRSGYVYEHIIPKEEVVESVKIDGYTNVYDLVMEDPHRNFVANGIVVSNCGKTIQALVAIPAGSPVLVVCPASLKGNWIKEAHRWRPDFKTEILSGRGSFRWPESGELLTVNYDILPPTKAQLKEQADESIAAFPTDVAFAGDGCPDGLSLIVDECHAIKSKKTLRTQRLKAIIRSVAAAGGRAYGLTGTPLANRQEELASLLQSFGLFDEAFGSWPRFLKLMSARKQFWGGYKWGEPNPMAIECLKKVLLRRRREQVLPELPTKTYQEIEVDIDASARSASDAARAALLAAGLDLTMVIAEQKSLGTVFEELAKARRALASAKIPAMLEIVKEYEEEDEPLVVFSAHRAPIDLLANRAGWAAITGSTPVGRRQEIVECFQAGLLKGLALTIDAGGVGFTLTRAHHVLFVDLEWTPAANTQSEDRVCRIGQDKGVVIKTLIAPNTIDEEVVQILRDKTAIIKRTIEAAAGTDGLYHLDPAALDAAAKTPAISEVPRILRQRPPQGQEEVWASEAILRLAGIASLENGSGFNKFDRAFGSSLAEQFRRNRTLSQSQWQAAVRLCRKYQGQAGAWPAEKTA